MRTFLPHSLKGELKPALSGEALGCLGKRKFPKSARLRKRGEFLAFNHRLGGGQIVLKIRTVSYLTLVIKNSLNRTRLGITITKKVGPAVKRNQIKRLVREFFRFNCERWPAGLDILFIAQHEAGHLKPEVLKDDLLKTGLRLETFKADKAGGLPMKPPKTSQGEQNGGQSANEAFAGDVSANGPPLAASEIWRLISHVPVKLTLGLIFVYQRFISPFLPPVCRFRPTCSSYAAEAFRTHGSCYGFYLSLRRILKCHPFHPGGYDPVPPTKNNIVK